jgi:hypothetical protein
MRNFLPIVLVASALITAEAQSQASPAGTRTSVFDDSTGESPLYPVGDAIPVYRAVLDLLYLDGNARPSLIIMYDTAAWRMGGPCPVAKCASAVWKHKSKIDTATVMSFARLSMKRPAIRPFGYPIPIVFLSPDDFQRMDADGREIIASLPKPPDLPKRTWGAWAELQRKYPGAWGVTTLSKVGFNDKHTEALVQAHQLCSDDCRVHETLFLRQTNGRWRVVERIPQEVYRGYSAFGRYVGPLGTKPAESEIIPLDRPGVPFEAAARADVYRAVLDSLYSVNGERPTRIVITNWFYSPPGLPAHKSSIDSALVSKFSVVSTIHAPLDAISRYRVPVSALPVDSILGLADLDCSRGCESDAAPFWIRLAYKYPGAWGLLGLTRIAFNTNRSQALVNTHHACGRGCVTNDTWFLIRTGKKWRIAERMAGANSHGNVEPMRYVGADISPIAFRPRRVQGIVTDAETGKPIAALTIRVRHMLESGVSVDDPSLRTDSMGHFMLTRLPLRAAMNLLFECPNGSRDGVVSVPLYVTPGLDTTINTSVSMVQCHYFPPGDSAGRVSGVSWIRQGPSMSRSPVWMYLTAGANPGARTRMRTCLNVIPLNEKYPPGDVVPRAMTESGTSPFLIEMSALATARPFGPVTVAPMVRGRGDGGGASEVRAVLSLSTASSPAGRAFGSM